MFWNSPGFTFFPQENEIPQQSKRVLKLPFQVIFEKNPYTRHVFYTKISILLKNPFIMMELFFIKTITVKSPADNRNKFVNCLQVFNFKWLLSK